MVLSPQLGYSTVVNIRQNLVDKLVYGTLVASFAGSFFYSSVRYQTSLTDSFKHAFLALGVTFTVLRFVMLLWAFAAQIRHQASQKGRSGPVEFMNMLGKVMLFIILPAAVIATAIVLLTS